MIMKKMNDINFKWSELESKSRKHVVRVQLDSVQGLNCFIGLIGATGARMFQMELDTTTPVHKNFLKRFRGLEIQVIPYSQSLKVYTIIVLERELTEIFTMFIEDVIDKLGPITNYQHALSIINQRVNYWKKLFSRVTDELLSAELQRGLFGELFFLSLLLQNSSDHHDTLRSWRGTESANQDFAKNGNAVEIKTTKANSSSVYISNEQQLDFTDWDHLFLGLISVTETSGSQNSLASTIEEVKVLINHDPELTEEFEKKLENAGVSVDMIGSYDEISYSINNKRFFQIKEGFPLIIKENFQSDAVYNVKYQIDLSSCNSYECVEEKVINAML